MIQYFPTPFNNQRILNTVGAYFYDPEPITSSHKIIRGWKHKYICFGDISSASMREACINFIFIYSYSLRNFVHFSFLRIEKNFLKSKVTSKQRFRAYTHGLTDCGLKQQDSMEHRKRPPPPPHFTLLRIASRRVDISREIFTEAI